MWFCVSFLTQTDNAKGCDLGSDHLLLGFSLSSEGSAESQQRRSSVVSREEVPEDALTVKLVGDICLRVMSIERDYLLIKVG